jgi:hypothetical protein
VPRRPARRPALRCRRGQRAPRGARPPPPPPRDRRRRIADALPPGLKRAPRTKATTLLPSQDRGLNVMLGRQGSHPDAGPHRTALQTSMEQLPHQGGMCRRGTTSQRSGIPRDMDGEKEEGKVDDFWKHCQ